MNDPILYPFPGVYYLLGPPDLYTSHDGSHVGGSVCVWVGG